MSSESDTLSPAPEAGAGLVASLRKQRSDPPPKLKPDPTQGGSASGKLLLRPVLGVEPALPWSDPAGADPRLRRVMLVMLGLFVITSAVTYFAKLPPIERAEAEKISPRLAKLVLEKQEKPKPVPVKVEEVKQKELKPDEKPLEKAASEVKQEQRRELATAKQPLTQEVAAAREKASNSGLVAMRDQLAALRSLSSESSSLTQNQQSVGMEGTSARVERDLIGKVATSGSGGVAGAVIAHSGGGKLASHTTTQVRGGSGAGGGSGPSLAEINKEAKSGKRSNEDIKLGFDANKSALYAVYRRALRENPTLEGRVVFKLTVDASGQVTACSIVSSAFKDPALEEKLVQRIQLINFGARPGVAAWTDTYHIDFVPAS